jgi:hypothetical protein
MLDAHDDGVPLYPQAFARGLKAQDEVTDVRAGHTGGRMPEHSARR